MWKCYADIWLHWIWFRYDYLSSLLNEKRGCSSSARLYDVKELYEFFFFLEKSCEGCWLGYEAWQKVFIQEFSEKCGRKFGEYEKRSYLCIAFEMVDVAQWLEHRIVVPGVVDSTPIFPPS